MNALYFESNSESACYKKGSSKVKRKKMQKALEVASVGEINVESIVPELKAWEEDKLSRAINHKCCSGRITRNHTRG